MTDFADELGPAYLNLVMRRLGHRISSEGDQYFARHRLAIPARATSTMTYLARHDHASVATIAEALGYSHQAVTKAVDQLEGLDLVVSGTSAEDLRVRQVSLTETGHLQIEKLQRMIGQIDAVLEQIFDETGVDLFRALRQFEKALERRSLLDRFIEAESGTESVSDE